MVYPKKVYFKDAVFFVGEQVYEPAEDTFLIAENITVTENDDVLDVGTGCGILAVLAADKAKRVLAVDINPHAVECTVENAEANGVKERIEVLQGDLFHPIKQSERFSLILFNSPYLPSELDEEKSWIGKAWSGGPDGRRVIDRFISDAPNFLADKGRILLVQSSLSDIDRTIKMFTDKGLQAMVVAQVKVPFETIVLVEAKRQTIG
jgi:release factor glutamine methyltransferase